LRLLELKFIFTIVIVNSRFLKRPQKRRHGNKLIYRCLSKTKSIGSGSDPESQAGRQSDGYDGWLCMVAWHFYGALSEMMMSQFRNRTACIRVENTIPWLFLKLTTTVTLINGPVIIEIVSSSSKETELGSTLIAYTCYTGSCSFSSAGLSRVGRNKTWTFLGDIN